MRQEERLTEALLCSAQPGSTLLISSPYLNLPRTYKQALAAASGVNIQILTASPSASGFFGAKGSAGFIPTAYSLLQRSAWRSLVRAWAQDPAPVHRSLLEYKRPAWQFHAKGIWYIPPGEALPTATMIGSSNYGYRSVQRDLECQLLIITSNLSLRQEMGREIDSLKLFSEDVSRQQLQPLQPKVSYKAHLAARLMRSFL